VSTLEQEAGYIHERFFGGPAPEEVAARYAAAHRQYGIAPDDRMEIILGHRLDIEAIELALRIGRRDRFLTAKIQVLFYLVEVRAAYHHRFVNTQMRRARAWRAILKAVPATVWKYGKGVWLVRRYGL
jgi:hypothetical protein